MNYTGIKAGLRAKNCEVMMGCIWFWDR